MQTHSIRKVALALILIGSSVSPVWGQTTPFAIKSAGSVEKKDGPMQVTVVFTVPVDPTTASDTSKYNLGAGVGIQKATPLTGLPGIDEPGNGEAPPTGRVIDNQCVVLEVTGLGTAATTLTINGVKDASGARTLSGAGLQFIPSGYKWTDVARTYTSPTPGRRASQVIAISDQGFDLFNNGRTGWAGEDEYTLVYKEVQGDFDFKARVEFQDYSSRWARAGIMVRERLDDGAVEGCLGRYVTAHVDPSKSWSDVGAGTITANDAFESNHRDVDYSAQSPVCGDGTHTSFVADTAGDGAGTPAYPEAWVRLQRSGDNITASYSTNGVDWSAGWVRTHASPLPQTMYLGPASCCEWGNINVANGTAAQSRYYLSQIRFRELSVPVVQTVTPTIMGFVATIKNGTTAFDRSTLQLTLNGTVVQASSIVGPDADGVTIVTYVGSTPLPNDVVNTGQIQFKDNASPAPDTVTRAFTLQVSYDAIPEDFATTQFSGTKGNMMVSAHQMPSGVTRTPGDENSAANAETEVQDGYIDPNTGEIVVNQVDGTFFPIDMVNFSATGDEGYFNSSNTPDYPDYPMPGSVWADEYTLQFVAYLDLKAGPYRMFVNSDDGFELSVGGNGLDVLGKVLGIFNTGRGATTNADPAGFEFVVTKAGVYPFRLLYWQGTGDASVEWYSQDYTTGERFLINAPATGAIKSYPEGRGRAYVKRFLPFPGKDNVSEQPTIEATLVDDLTSVVDGSIQMTLDGQTITPTITKTAGTHTLSWKAPSAFKFGTAHAGQLIFAENNGVTRTNDFNFTVRGIGAADLPPDSFWIEIEDFDFNKGQSLEVASTMPYAGGAYGDLVGQGYSGAVNGIDYHRNDRGPLNGTDLGGYVYRTDIPGWVSEQDQITDYFVPMYDSLNAGLASERPGNPISTVTVNYRTGWSGGSWYDYTRTVPSGTYAVYLIGSWYQDGPPALGQIDCDLAKVVSGVGTSNQTLQALGTFYAAADGTTDSITPLKSPDGSLAIFKASGKTTLRVTDRSGDIDYFVLAPQSDVPPKVVEATPANGAQAPRSAPISIKIQDFSQAVAPASVKLMLDAQNITAQANPTKTADITSLLYTPSPLWEANSTHTYVVSFSDDSVPAKTYSLTNTFRVSPLGSPGQFLIEMEDFNFNGGQTKAVASVMPYLGGAYDGLGGINNVDYHNDDNVEAASGGHNYRTGAGDVSTDGTAVDINIDGTMGTPDGKNRGTGWDMVVSWKIGWAGTPDWQNYTRTFPSGTYNVYAAISSADTSGATMGGSFGVIAGSATTTNQTVLSVGSFDSPVTGGWGNNALVPMKDVDGSLGTVALAGTETVRYSSRAGDMDYILLVPGAAVAAPSIFTAPQPVAADVGGSATFAVVAAGTGPLSYQWLFKGEPLENQTNTSLALANVQPKDAGAYSVKVTGGTGLTATSTPVALTVGGGEAPQFTSITIDATGNLTLVWTGGGTLQINTDLGNPNGWTDLPATSPFTYKPTQKMIFGRLKK